LTQFIRKVGLGQTSVRLTGNQLKSNDESHPVKTATHFWFDMSAINALSG
jgi:hypothetical protein